jgi:hypothetical protein
MKGSFMKIKRFSHRFILLFVLGFAVYHIAGAQSNNQAGLVIDYGEGETASYCIGLGEGSLNGLDLLLQAGLTVSADHTSQGSALCKIGTVGCPVDDCFCDSPPNYWSYWHLQDGQWIYAAAGASSYAIHPGSVDGWAWGDGSPPAVRSLDQICSNPEAIRGEATGIKNAATSEVSRSSNNPVNYLLFGILASVLGVGLVWLVFKQ